MKAKIATMSPTRLCTELEWVEVLSREGKPVYPADMRRGLRDERVALTVALRTGNGNKIAAAAAEAKRVAKMWGLE